MAEHSNISWTDATVNFWSGCTAVSAGCKNCYAEVLSDRFNALGKWGKGAKRIRHESAFKLALSLNKKPWVCEACSEARLFTDYACPQCMFRTETHRCRVFSLSLGDWLDDEVPVEWLVEMMRVVMQCDQLCFLLLTKRPELFKKRIQQCVKWLDGNQ